VNSPKEYSLYCKNKKKIPNNTVKKTLTIAISLFPRIVAWCPKVKIKPEAKSTQLPNKGIAQGFTALIPTG
jgi:hypothetical protein